MAALPAPSLILDMGFAERQIRFRRKPPRPEPPPVPTCAGTSPEPVPSAAMRTPI